MDLTHPDSTPENDREDNVVDCADADPICVIIDPRDGTILVHEDPTDVMAGYPKP